MATQKIKKSSGENRLTLELVENPDIVASVAALAKKPFTVGFAAETQDLVAYAKGKLQSKNLDLIVANDVSDQTIGFNSDNNATTVINHKIELQLPSMSKSTLSRKLIDIIAQEVGSSSAAPGSAL